MSPPCAPAQTTCRVWGLRPPIIHAVTLALNPETPNPKPSQVVLGKQPDRRIVPGRSTHLFARNHGAALDWVAVNELNVSYYTEKTNLMYYIQLKFLNSNPEEDGVAKLVSSAAQELRP